MSGVSQPRCMPANSPFRPKPTKSEKPSGSKLVPALVAPVHEATSTGSGQADPAEMDDFIKGWHDSSFELRRGLWVIETDLDPAVTHGVAHKRNPKSNQGNNGGR